MYIYGIIRPIDERIFFRVVGIPPTSDGKSPEMIHRPAMGSLEIKKKNQPSGNQTWLIGGESEFISYVYHMIIIS